MLAPMTAPESTTALTTQPENPQVLRRTPVDVIFGLLAIAVGLFLLSNAVVATVLSVFMIAWSTLVSGVILLVGALFRIKSGGFWSGALGGSMLLVVGLFMLRNPVIGAVALTLMAGAMFFSSGLVRVAVGFQMPVGRWILVLSGLISVGLGLWVMFNVTAATPQLLGIILSIQMLMEGLNLMLVGRVRAPKKA